MLARAVIVPSPASAPPTIVKVNKPVASVSPLAILNVPMVVLTSTTVLGIGVRNSVASTRRA